MSDLLRVIAPHRGQDKWGSGAFGASRGSRTHEGLDVAVWPGSMVLSIVPGLVADLGYAYTSGVGNFNDSDPFRIITMVGPEGYEIRYFYVMPVVEVGDEIEEGGRLGFAQNLWRRYPPEKDKIMTPHVHIEIRDPDGNLIDPEGFKRA